MSDGYIDDSIPVPKRNLDIAKVGCFVLLGALVATFAYFMLSGQESAAEPRINSNFTDTNQTRADLVKVIEAQRLAVYSLYPLEWTFCESKLEGEIVSADRSDIRIKGQTITEAIHCENKAGVKVVYDIQFDQITQEYSERIRLPGV